MKLYTVLSLFGLGVGALAFSTQGCSSDDTSSTGTGGDSTGRVPPTAEGAPTTSTDERTFALRALHLGEADRSGNKNKDAWKDYGYNLDGQITKIDKSSDSPDLKNVCNRAGGAPASNLADGNEGIDNSFGHNILALLDSFVSTPSKSISDAIAKGDFTILLKIKGLTDDPAQTNTGLSGTLLVGAKYGDTAPTFDQSTDWPFRAEPQIGINGAYINKGVFVNGAGGATVKLSLAISGQTLDLTINKALITFKHNPASKELTDGTIAGVLDTDQFLTGLTSVAGSFSTDLCSGSTIEGIKDSIRQASDILADGSQKAGVACTGISVGIGFTAKQVANPTKPAPEGAIPDDPCKPKADAGADSGQQQQQDAGQDAGDGGQ